MFWKVHTMKIWSRTCGEHDTYLVLRTLFASTKYSEKLVPINDRQNTAISSVSFSNGVFVISQIVTDGLRDARSNEWTVTFVNVVAILASPHPKSPIAKLLFASVLKKIFNIHDNQRYCQTYNLDKYNSDFIQYLRVHTYIYFIYIEIN